MALVQSSERRCSESRAATAPTPRSAKLTVSVSSMKRAMASSEGVAELRDGNPRGSGEVSGKRPERIEELVGKLVHRLEHDATSDASDQHFRRTLWEAAFLRQSDGLASA